AAALSELGENTKDDPGFRVPAVDWERTGRDVLTMEWIDGVKMNDIAGLAAAGHDLKAIATNLIQSFLRHTLRDGFFHADMHPGNLFVEADGTIVAVDLGIAGRLGKKERRFLAEILYGFIVRDYQRVAEVHFEAGYVPRQHNVSA
ncbi:MAG: ubiquinone biosynthesis protein UbiB, partial [Mesorhizobium sp.]